MPDLTTRIAETAAFIEAQLAADEAAAMAWDDAPWLNAGTEATRWKYVGRREVFYDNGRSETVSVIDVSGAASLFTEAIQVKWDAKGVRVAHIARHDPARALRHVKAVRGLVAEIMSDQHYSADAGYYSCSQATDPLGHSAVPGSGCSDPERAGKPCDCGRDERVARMLGIIAGEWREVP